MVLVDWRSIYFITKVILFYDYYIKPYNNNYITVKQTDLFFRPTSWSWCWLLLFQIRFLFEYHEDTRLTNE